MIAERDRWQPTVNMWVYEETLPDGRLLSNVINTEHENVKSVISILQTINTFASKVVYVCCVPYRYLPGFKLPENVVAITDLVESCKDATMLVFVVPHQFVERICKQLAGKIRSDARAISLIKGLDESSNTSNDIDLISRKISFMLSIDVSVLMGANLANDIAAERFSEATIGYSQMQLATAQEWRELFETKYFRIELIDDVCGVEICGALKNIVAVASGFVDGLYGEGQGNNSKAAVMRLGMQEIRRFCALFDPSTIQEETFWASCGLADMITSCYGGRNRKFGDAFIREKLAAANNPSVQASITIEGLENKLLNGQKLQGPATALKVYHYLTAQNLTQDYPLFNTVYRICYENHSIDTFFEDICVGYDRRVVLNR